VKAAIAALLMLASLTTPAFAQVSRPDLAANWPRSPHACMVRAAEYFRVPLSILLAVRAQEAGTVGMAQLNVDGSYDYGIMQINSRWLPLLSPVGYTAAVLQDQECANVVAGAWILARELKRAGAWNRSRPQAQAFWRAVGAYHSRDPVRNRVYAEHVWQRYVRLRTAIERGRIRRMP
jgi:hypothetical protein